MPESSQPTRTLENSYAEFIQAMRDPSARPLLSRIRHFLSTTYPAAPPTQKPSIYTEFMNGLIADTVRILNGFEEGFVEECVEYLVTNQLGPQALESLYVESRESALMEKLITFHWLLPTHIGLTVEAPLLEEYIQLAVDELEQLPKYKTPRDKQTLLLNAARLVCGGVGERVNADDLLPCLIVTMIRARPAKLLSTLHYIQLYSCKRISSDDEERFLFTTCSAAVAFIEQLDRQAVKLDDVEYAELIKSSQPLLTQYRVMKRHEEEQSNDLSSLLDLQAIESRAKQVIREVRSSKLVSKSLGAFKQFINDAIDTDTENDADTVEEERQVRLAMALSLAESVPLKETFVETDI